MIRVVKVGGSLLDWPQLGEALGRWLAGESPALHVLLAGGGAVAEAIRKADRDFGLGEELSHWLCIDGLSITARVVAAVMPQCPLISTYADLKLKIASERRGGVIFDPRDFLVEHESQLPGRRLPHDWAVTSDSMAARLAECLPADELVLLKSCEAPDATLTDLTASGYVDRYFPTAAGELLRLRFVNLRSCNLRGSNVRSSNFLNGNFSSSAF